MADGKFGLIRIVIFEAVCRRDLLNCAETRQDGKNLGLTPDIISGKVLRWWLRKRVENRQS